MTLGVLFLVVILCGVYFFIADPYNLKPLIFGSTPTTQKSDVTNGNTADTSAQTGSSTETAGGFQLSEAQKQALVSLGIDPAAVPSSISPAQETCFVGALGEARVAEIKAGAVPNAIEFLKAKVCI